jgi:hypothetical protein
MTILETQRFARFSDSHGNAITLELTASKDPGTEEPGWFIAETMSDNAFCGPCMINVDKFQICTTHLAQQKETKSSLPAYRFVWIPLLNDKEEVVQYLHMYNKYVDHKSKPVSFRVRTKNNKGYDQYSL